MKIETTIRRQLNELAGRVAGVSGGVEQGSLEEMKGVKATLERLKTMKEEPFVMEEFTGIQVEMI